MDNADVRSGRIDFWMGDSRGRWEGDTLVVDVTELQRSRPGSTAPAISTATRCTWSSATRPSTPIIIDYEATIEDPKVFTRPWKISMPLYRRVEANAQLLEYECYVYAEDDAEAAAGGDK